MEELCEDLWELICKLIYNDDYQFLEPLSLVSTTFLSITNRVRSTLVIADETVPFLGQHLLRFRNLKRIRFSSCNMKNVNSSLRQISDSGLHLESLDIPGAHRFPDFVELGFKKEMMRNVKELKLCGIGFPRDSHLVKIGEWFPLLQVLDISYPVYYRDPGDDDYSPCTDSGIISLSLCLKELLRIDISRMFSITDKSLVALSMNCPLLREISFGQCGLISSEGIEFVLRNSRGLESLALSRYGLKPLYLSISKDAFLSARSLSRLDLSGVVMYHELIRSIGDAKLPLRWLNLSYCENLTFDDILYLVTNYQRLFHLYLKGLSFLSDEMVMELRMFLRNLKFLDLSECFGLTAMTFFSIIETCGSLEELNMNMNMIGTNFEAEEYSKELDIKSGIKSLTILRCDFRDECLGKISRHFPALETLDVPYCHSITGDGIVQMLRNCGELTYLNISGCSGVKSLGGMVDFELPKLEYLTACENEWIDDEVVIEIISKRCRRLLSLDLEGCLNVSSRGVKEVVQNCTRLRKINLNRCKVDKSIVKWMFSANPSLRTIELDRVKWTRNRFVF